MSLEQVENFTWMNKDYFKSILSKYEGHDNVELVDFNVSAGAKKGENFASAVYRVTLKYLINNETKEASFILKTNSSSSAIAEMLEEMGTFKAETNIYANILPQCEKLLNFKLAPRLVHVDSNALVLEDLNQLNYKLANRKERFDLPRAKLVLEKLAKYHAATASINSKNPKQMEQYMSSAIDSEEMTPVAFFFTVSMQETLETIRNTPELAEFLEKLENFDIIKREKNVFTRSADDKFHVLNHGDLWINNMFFSFNDNKEPTDALLVDYQECWFGSPGLDLTHFLYTSCDLDVYENHVDELIKFYYDHLSATLKLLDYPNIPTLEDIQSDFARKVDHGLVLLFSIVPAMMIENVEHANPENFIADGEGAAAIRREVYGNPKFVEVLKFMLPKLAEKKLF